MMTADVAVTVEDAVALHRAGHLDQAEAAYLTLLQDNPDDPDALHFLALIRHQNRHFEDAVALLRRSLELQPANPSAQNNYGNLLKRLGQHGEALEAYKAALTLNPNIVEAWCNIGVLLRADKQPENSVAMLEQAVALDPGSGEAWHNLGVSSLVMNNLDRAAEAFERCIDFVDEGWSSPVWHARVLCRLGRREKAIAMLEELVARRPDSAEAAFQLEALRGDERDRAPDAYVRTHFDRFAETFDTVLTNLEYRAPEMVGERVRALYADGAGLDVADLGCGTGLAGPLIRPVAGQLVGVDLSTGMLARAHDRKIYDFLVECELGGFLHGADPGSFDLCVSVDTLCYIGALEDVCAGFVHALKPGGRAIVSVERLPEGHADEGRYRLAEAGRYVHGGPYLRRVAAEAGLEVEAMDTVVLRKEMGDDVSGFIVTLRLPE